jgi:Malectin domain
MSRRAPARGRLVAAVGAFSLLAAMAIAATPAAAVNVNQGSQVVSTDPADFTPQVTNGSVNALVQLGSNIYAAGTFTTVRQTLTSANITRNRIFAFNATTGVIDPTFNPNLNGAVNSLDTDGTSIFAGGSFTTANGLAAKRVVKLTTAGTLAAGQPKAPNSGVNEVVVRGSRLYIGGAFTNVGGTGTPRTALAALNKDTGAVLPDVNLTFAGLFNGGAVNVKRMDMTPDGTALVAIGNFLTVGGLTREQIVKIDIPATGAATVSTWATDRLDQAHNSCAGVFDSWTRDIDFAPDGSYFVLSTTGAFAGGPAAGTMCDSTSRWENGPTGAGQQPTWVDYTGGDTTYGVAVSGGVIYTGGHMRWQNNPYQGDQAGPGAVPREGIAALDSVNGLPLSWNPGRDRGVGAQALYATSTGLWVGSDTTKIGKPRETHDRIAFMPLAGGTTIPTVNAAVLPNDIFQAQRPAAGSTNVLYRVASGGPLQAADNGPDWTAPDGFVDGGNTAAWGTTVPVDATVPSSTPAGVFATERWSTMHWHFPVASGTNVTVRLYFANQYGGTSQVGQRVFNVDLEGTRVLDHFDIVATTGDHRGTMKSFTATSDGEIDIDFGAITENPLVNGIEILDNSLPTTSTPGVLLRRGVDSGGVPTGTTSTANSTIDWSSIRGAFYLNGKVFYGKGDGGLYSRTFNKTTGALGAEVIVNLYDDPDDAGRIPFSIANLTGMFYDSVQHRLYYTLFNDSTLYYRYLTPESLVVGAQTFTADNGGVDLSTVSGMTLAGGNILYGSSADGDLRSVPFGSTGITGSPTIVSSDGTWKSRALFVPND